MTTIREMTAEDLEALALLLLDTYNGPPWNDNWTVETAKAYLLEFMEHRRFQGYVALNGGNSIVGAMLGHAQVWCTGDEFYINEFYMQTASQGAGLGRQLMAQTEAYVKAQGLIGIALLTNRHFPAKEFYSRNGFVELEPMVFMYKDI